jgi:S1-C subfamily serine protease
VLILTGALAVPVRAQRPIASQFPGSLIHIPRLGAMLGIEDLDSDCVYTVEKDTTMVLFNSEPRIREVDPDGPSAGILRSGDVIVAIGGRLITTRQAGITFTSLTAGEPVELVIRRVGRIRTVTIVPTAAAEDDSLEVPLPFPLETGAMADYIDSLIGSINSGFLEFDRYRGGSLDLIPTHVLLGVELRLEGFSVKEEDGARIWSFHRPLLVVAVEPDSPADIGGLLPGDVLTHIDGVRLDRRAGGRLFSAISPGQTIVWTVNRSGERLEIEITAGHPRR